MFKYLHDKFGKQIPFPRAKMASVAEGQVLLLCLVHSTTVFACM